MNTCKLSRLAAGLLCSAALTLAAPNNNLQPGKAELKSAGALAFGPNGILFVGDTAAASIVALDVKDSAAAKSTSFEVNGINDKIASMLGIAADQILINDTAVNPISKNVYLSVSRGRGPEAAAVILRVTPAGKISEVSLADIPHAAVKFSDAPATPANGRQVETITALAYVDGNVMVAGLSNEEFSSSLRSIPFPFTDAAKGAGIQIYHGSHGRFETASPVRTFVPYEIADRKEILAAYTCTPLVKIPVSELKPGAKVQGVTIAELGAGNRPLDMIVYEKGGKHFILMANSARGMMKLSADGLENFKPIVAHTEITGVPYETIANMDGVQHLNKVDESTGLILQKTGASMNLRTIALP